MDPEQQNQKDFPRIMTSEQLLDLARIEASTFLTKTCGNIHPLREIAYEYYVTFHADYIALVLKDATSQQRIHVVLIEYDGVTIRAVPTVPSHDTPPR